VAGGAVHRCIVFFLVNVTGLACFSNPNITVGDVARRTFDVPCLRVQPPSFAVALGTVRERLFLVRVVAADASRVGVYVNWERYARHILLLMALKAHIS